MASLPMRLFFLTITSFCEAEIEAMKQQRLDNWIAVVKYVPTEEELAEMEALAAQEPPPEE
jgi:hypothetical protein